MEKTCIITNKRNKRLEDFVKKNWPETGFEYSCIVYDRDCNSLRVREHEDGELYMFGKPLRTPSITPIDCHDLFSEIPEKRFVFLSKESLNNPDMPLSAYSRIIVMPDKMDFEGYLAIVAFLKEKGPCCRARCLANDYEGPEETKERLAGFLEGKIMLPYFDTEFDRHIRKRAEEGFVPYFPMERDIRYLKAETRMTNKEFAEFFGTNIRNVENWMAKPSSLGSYIYDLFEYKLLKEGVI